MAKDVCEYQDVTPLIGKSYTCLASAVRAPHTHARALAHTCVQLALAAVVFSSRHSNEYQRPAFTVISSLLFHGSNHCRSGVSALAQDRNGSD